MLPAHVAQVCYCIVMMLLTEALITCRGRTDVLAVTAGINMQHNTELA